MYAIRSYYAVKLTMGNFNTFLGYEVISPVSNFNYSTSYLFSYGPFSHTGLKADFTLSEDFSLMLGVMNDTDLTEFNPTGDYAFGAQLGYSGQFLNVLVDPSFFEIDYTGGFDFVITSYSIHYTKLYEEPTTATDLPVLDIGGSATIQPSL